MPNGFILRPGDRVVFRGDSITEQQLYTNYVEAYLASRYPELKLTFFNAGWGRDTAPGGCDRLDRDVQALGVPPRQEAWTVDLATRQATGTRPRARAHGA